MILPEIIMYLLTLRYPGSGLERGNYVCYRGILQTIIPLMPAGSTVNFTIRPLHGVYAWLSWVSRVGSEVVPNTMTGSIAHYGSTPWSGLVTQRGRDDPSEYFVFITDQEPASVSVTNISPLAQRFETIADFIVIPSPEDLKIVYDALLRLHTSTVSEQLLQQVAHLLGVISGRPQEPLPSMGGG